MVFEVMGNLTCNECGEYNEYAELVPLKAWQPGGAYWTGTTECFSCGTPIEFRGEVTSELENE